MGKTILETFPDGSPRVVFYTGAAHHAFLAPAQNEGTSQSAETPWEVPSDEPFRTPAIKATPVVESEVRSFSVEVVEPKPTLYQRLQTLVFECDYRGEQLAGPDVGGCGCRVAYFCGRARGLPLTPNEVSLRDCYECVQTSDAQPH